MAGMKIVTVACDDKGNIDVEDLKAKAGEYSSELCGLMVTYPSTHGVFESRIRETWTPCTTQAGRSTWTAPT